MKIKTKVWLTAPGQPHLETSYSSSELDMAECGWVPVGAFEVEFAPLTREVAIPQAVALLRAQQNSIRAQSERRCGEIGEDIQNLLSLTYEEAK